jgi:protein-S-isoprenylcysteine O-methyltransferase Ste14
MTASTAIAAASEPPKMNLPARLVMIFLSTGLYFGLAFLGLGGVGAYFSHPPLVALAVVFGAVSIVSVFAGGSLNPGVREDRSNRWVLIPLIGLGLLAGWLPAFTDRHDFWTIDGDMARWIGVVLAAIGCTLRIWPVFVLGHRFSGLVAIQPGHQLVTTGIYRVIRHPSYLGLLVTMVGWSLAFRAGAGLLLTALIFIPLVARMNSEERNTTPFAPARRA